jgi:hypothetical protein
MLVRSVDDAIQSINARLEVLASAPASPRTETEREKLSGAKRALERQRQRPTADHRNGRDYGY